MKTIFCSFLLFISVCASGQTFDWAKATVCGDSTASAAFIMDSKIDKAGNIYVVGGYSSPYIAFGTDTLLNSAFLNFCNLFLVKYDPSGNVIWARTGDSNCNAQAWKLAIDKSNNIYIVGYFNGAGITLGSFTLTNADSGYNDMYITKYDSAGNVLWAKRAGGPAYDNAWDVCVNDSGYVFMSGWFNSSTISFDTFTLHNLGSTNSFLVKYDSMGNVIWARHSGGNYADEVHPVATDAFGNVYITGVFMSGSIIFGADTLFNTGTGNMYLAKYGPTGNVLWAKSVKGDYFDEPWALNIDKFGGVYITGGYRSDSITTGGVTLVNSHMGSSDICLIKFDTNGNAIWGRTAGGANFDDGLAVTTDKYGNVYLAGDYASDSITFGPIKFYNTGAPNTDDIFLVVYDSSGAELWGVSARGIKDDYIDAICVDTSGIIYCGGAFYSPEISFGSTILVNPNAYNAFIFKLPPPTVKTATFTNTIRLYIYPNPTSGIVNIKCPTGITLKNIVLENLIGQEIPFKLSASGENLIQIQADNAQTELVILKIVDHNNSQYFYRLLLNKN